MDSPRGHLAVACNNTFDKSEHDQWNIEYRLSHTVQRVTHTAHQRSPSELCQTKRVG